MSTTFISINQVTVVQRAESKIANAGLNTASQPNTDVDSGVSPPSDNGSRPDSGSQSGSFVSALSEVDDNSVLANVYTMARNSVLAKDSVVADVSTLADNSALAEDSVLDDNVDDNDSALADEDTKTSHPVDEICMATKECVTGSGHHRQVVSHIFGRNKKCTRALAGHWIMWCRQHYQRFCYRANREGGNWAWSQLSLVRIQLEKFEEAGIVRNWTIALRKREQDALDAENTALLLAGQSAATGTDAVWERFLVPHLGHGKTFAEVRDVLDAIEEEFETPEYIAREKKKKIFPGVEFLATFPEGKVQNKTTKVPVAKPTPKPSATKIAVSKPVIPPKTNVAVAPPLGSFKRKTPSTPTTPYAATKSSSGHHKRRRLVRGSDISMSDAQGSTSS